LRLAKNLLTGNWGILQLDEPVNVADVFVGELDDAAMTAQAGAVASAVRFLAKSIATGTISTIVENVALSEARGNLTSGRGLGEPLILDYVAEQRASQPPITC
jgi:hypothetical protein